MAANSIVDGTPFKIAFSDKKSEGNRLKGEWPMIHPLLRGAILTMAEWLSYAYNIRTLTLTCLYRTAAENKKDGGKPNSLHVKNRAADIRTWPYKPHVLDEIAFWWIENIRNNDPRLQIEMEANHIHVEFDEG